jgi:hypothetical protein
VWRISSLFWPAVEWWERHAERRRIRYCVEYKLRGSESPSTPRVSLLARVRSLAALLLLTIAGRG